VNPYAVKYGLGRAWGYSALSSGMWLVYWFHRNRKLLDGELGRGRDDALVHSIGLLVPVWNIFVLYWLYREATEALTTSSETVLLSSVPPLGLSGSLGWF
jgi:hypothetical protein